VICEVECRKMIEVCLQQDQAPLPWRELAIYRVRFAVPLNSIVSVENVQRVEHFRAGQFRPENEGVRVQKDQLVERVNNVFLV
jgi:hypothetical protein